MELDQPNAFFIKTSYEDSTFRKVLVSKKKNTPPSRTRSSQQENQHPVELERAYAEKFPLSDNKKNDIKDLIKRNIVPKYYYNAFFKSLLEI